MSITATDSDLGRHLLTVRGFQFVLAALGDPYAQLLADAQPDAVGEQLRRGGALHHSGTGAWVTADAATAATLLADHRLGTRHPGTSAAQQHIFDNLWESMRMCHVTPLDDAYLNQSDKDYERLARMAEPVLGHQVIGAWKAEIATAVARALDHTEPQFDLVTDLASPLVIGSITDMYGLPAAAGGELLQLYPRLSVALDAGLCPPTLPAARELLGALDRLRTLLGDVIAERRVNGGDDVISALLATTADRDLAADDVLAICTLQVVAGASIAVGLIGNAVEALLDDREHWTALCDDPTLAAAAVDETLRWAPPVRMYSRIVQESLELHGHTIDADSHIVILVDVANRHAGDQPGRFDITRASRRNLSLAGNTYEPVVAPLARTQATLALQALASRMPQLRALEPASRRMRSAVSKAMLQYPVSAR
jgi:P450-derived glycosyltransferase activator